MALTKTQVSELYVSIFNRASEKAGNEGWQAQDMTAAEMATAMLDTDAAKTYFGASLDTDLAFVQHIYLNTLNKTYADDTAGIDGWVSQLTSGTMTRGELVADMVDVIADYKVGGSKYETADDITKAAAAQFVNRVAVSDNAADTVTTAWSGDTQMNALVDSMSFGTGGLTVTSDEATVTTTNGMIATYVDAAVANAGNPDDASSFTLTHSPDTATSNIFVANRVWNPDGSDQMNSLNDDDVLTGSGTNPTLNFTFVNDTESGDLNIMPELNGIETVNVDFTADAAQTLDLQDATGIVNLNANRIDDIAAANVTFDNIQEKLTTAKIASSNDNTTSNVIFDHKASALSGTADEVALTLDEVQVNNVRVDAVTEGYETINLTSTGEANTLNSLTVESVQTLNISGDQDLRLGGTTNVVNPVQTNVVESTTSTAGLLNVAGSLTSVDASTLAGNLTYHIGGEISATADDGTNLVSLAIKTGSGDDKLVLTNGQTIGTVAGNTDTIDAGEGSDTLSLTGNDIITAGTTANITGVEILDIHSGLDQEVSILPAVIPVALADTTRVDFDAFNEDLTTINVKNDGSFTLNSGAIVSAAEVMNANLNNMTVAQASDINLYQGTTGNNGLLQNILVSDVKTNTASDTLGVSIETATNTDVRFNFNLTDTASTTFENITLNDNDGEDNTVQLTSFANHTGTITATGGIAGKFLNLDSTANAYTKVTNGATGDATTADTASVASFGQNATVTDRDTAVDYSLDTKAAGELLIAKTIDASTYLGDFIARVGTENQTITTNGGNDTIIFADRTGISSSTAGLTVDDKIAMGAGNDTIVIDGTGAVVLGASEWTNVTGVDSIQLAGFAGSTATLLVTDQLVDQADNGSNITIINNDGDLSTNAEIAATIDLRQMSATNGITFIGANGGGLATLTSGAKAVQTIMVDDVTANGTSILDGGDRDTLTNYTPTGTDSGINGAGVAGSAYGLQATADADWIANFGAGVDGNANVLNYHATTATNEVTVGDLANTINFSTLRFDNDTATAQTYTVTLNDSVVDNLVDASHTANTTAVETLTMSANDNTVLPAATGAFALSAGTVTASFNLVVTGGGGTDVIATGAGADTITGGAGNDTINGGAGDDTIVFAATAALNGVDAITSFTSTSDKLDLQAIGDTDGAVTTITTAFTVANNEVYFVDGSGTANSADSATNAAAVIKSAAGGGTNVDDAANTFNSYFVIQDDNNSAIYHYVNNGTDDSDILAAELTLVGTIDDQVIAADIIA